MTTAAICGSDLHIYDAYIPTMKEDDILGHEFMGIVEEAGPNHPLRKGDRVLPFQISCGTCYFCRRMETTLCDSTNPEGAENMQKAYGQAAAGLFGYSHLYGGYPGEQAQYVRMPCADFGAFKVPESLADDQILFLTDIFPAGSWQLRIAVSRPARQSPSGVAPRRTIRHSQRLSDGGRPRNRSR